MLVLTRREGEEVIIDGQVSIKVLRTKGNRVVIGVEAPADVSIQRQELTVESVLPPSRRVRRSA